jgi:ribosomal protein S25
VRTGGEVYAQLYDDVELTAVAESGEIDVDMIPPEQYDWREEGLTRGEPEWESRWATFLWLQVNGFRPEDALRRWDRKEREARNAQDRNDSPCDHLAPECASSPCDHLGDESHAQVVTQEETDEEEPGSYVSTPNSRARDHWARIERINESKKAVARYRRVLAAKMLSPFAPMTSSALAASLGCSRSSAQRVLRDLVEQGVARQTGEHRLRRYYGTGRRA